MRDTSASLLPGHRVCSCGWRPVTQEGVAITRKGDTYGVGGVRVCGSVWTCPVCAVKVAATRTDELVRGIKRWHAVGGAVLLVTLTIRHSRHEGLRENLDALTAAMRRVWAGRGGAAFRSAYGVRGLVRNLEATYGFANGWHPHAHVLLFVDAVGDVELMRSALSARWLSALAAEGLDASEERGVHIQVEPVAPRSGDLIAERQYDETLGQYVTKLIAAEEVERAWTAGHELAWSHIKRTRGERFTPWMLLAAVDRVEELPDDDGDELVGFRAPALWQEFASAFFGRRQLFWSRGLRELLEVEPEATDEELAEATDAEAVVVARVPARSWYWLRTHALVPALLDYAEAHGVEGLGYYLSGVSALAAMRGAPYAWMRPPSSLPTAARGTP